MRGLPIQIMHRFFVEPELLKKSDIDIALPKELAHQVRDVLRLNTGEHLLLLDNSGDEVLAAVAKISKAGVEVRLLERRPGKRAAGVHIMLCQGLLKSAPFSWVPEQSNRVCVSVLPPLICP